MRRVAEKEVNGRRRRSFRLMSHHMLGKEKEKYKDGWMNNRRLVGLFLQPLRGRRGDKLSR